VADHTNNKSSSSCSHAYVQKCNIILGFVSPC